MAKMELRTHGDEPYSKSYVSTGKSKVRVQEQENTFIPVAEGTDATNNNWTDLVSNNNDAAISAGYRSCRTTQLLTLVILVCLWNVKPAFATTEVAAGTEATDNNLTDIELIKHIIKEGDKFCINYRQVEKYGLCWVDFGRETVSSDESQKGRNLTLVSNETWCTMCINNFQLESVILFHLNGDSSVIRIVENEVFGEIVQDKLVVYTPNDLEANIKIMTVGQNTPCFIQLPILNDTITSNEYGNMTLTTRLIEYRKASIICSYNVTCNIEGMNYSIFHEKENCSVPSYPGHTGHSTITGNSRITGYSTIPGNRTITTPSNSGSESDKTKSIIKIISTVVGTFISIGIIILISWKCKVLDKIKQQCRSRKHSEVYDAYELEHTDEEGKPMHLQEPESEALSNTVRPSCRPLQKEKHVSTSISLDL